MRSILVTLCLAWFLTVLPTRALALEILVSLPDKEGQVGHVVVKVRTFSPDEVIIYDFGRYGRTWGKLNFEGEGVMRVWTGRSQVETYMRSGFKYHRTLGWEIAVTEEQEKDIHQYYQELIATATSVTDQKTHVRYILPEDYHGVTNPCSVKALEGMKKVLPSEQWRAILDPKFNRGEGFPKDLKKWFSKVQQELGLDDVLAPWDMVRAFEAAQRENPVLVPKVNEYIKVKPARKADKSTGAGKKAKSPVSTVDSPMKIESVPEIPQDEAIPVTNNSTGDEKVEPVVPVSE